jgi:hypothetical protein
MVIHTKTIQQDHVNSNLVGRFFFIYGYYPKLDTMSIIFLYTILTNDKDEYIDLF